MKSSFSMYRSYRRSFLASFPCLSFLVPTCCIYPYHLVIESKDAFSISSRFDSDLRELTKK